MDSQALKLDEFIAEYPFRGEWEVSYTDGTHLPKGEYVKLGDITIDASEEIAQAYPILPFTFCPVSAQKIECRFSALAETEAQTKKEQSKRGQQLEQIEQAKKARVEEALRVIPNQLADSLVRTGILRPEFCLMEEQTVEMQFRKVMERLSRFGYLTLVADTSALRRGVISFLHKTLRDVQIWTVVPVFVMTEVQRQAGALKEIWYGKKPQLKNCRVLGKRPQITAISRELNHIRQWRPVEMLTTLPEHLGQSNGASKVDRLIIESVKNLKRDRGLHRGVYLLTGDKDMASLATLENQESLHVGVPSFATLENQGSLHVDVPALPEEISSVRYDSHNSGLVLTPIHYLLWDLAEVFSTIRFCNKERSCAYELVYYSKARDGFFAHDVLEIRRE